MTETLVVHGPLSTERLLEITGVDVGTVPRRSMRDVASGRSPLAARAEPDPPQGTTHPTLWWLRPACPFRPLLHPRLGPLRRSAALSGIVLSRYQIYFIPALLVAAVVLRDLAPVQGWVPATAAVVGVGALALISWSRQPTVSTAKFRRIGFRNVRTTAEMSRSERLWTVHVEHLWRRSGDRVALSGWAWDAAVADEDRESPAYRTLVEAAAVSSARRFGVSPEAARVALEVLDVDRDAAAELTAAATGGDPELLRRWLGAGAGFIDRRRCGLCARSSDGELVPW